MEDDLEAFEFIQDLGPVDDFLPAPTRSEKTARGKRKNIVQEKQDESRELQQYVTMSQFE
ncbi:MAG: hypothetical protein KVP17_000368 [Porospora cf. gigantea B]|uniref:uncharacterized protein n=1 Tax=Porospora cf. gigantea B TaxID=2853592 RepID=UPI003571AA75|nr:MAG: hypothetical protein KVP17_000368 [Porospora cf. gigantea B]